MTKIRRWKKVTKYGDFVEILSVQGYGGQSTGGGKRTAHPIRRSSSIQRSRKNFWQLAQNNFSAEDSSFLTLTFSEKNNDWHDVAKKFKKFYRGSDKKFLAVLEKHKKGGYHIHCLINIKKSNYQERCDRKIAKWWGHGFVDVKKCSENIFLYMLKYMTKGAEDARDPSTRLYLQHNLDKPTVEVYDETWSLEDTDIREIQEDYPVQISSQKYPVPKGFGSVEKTINKKTKK